MEKKILKRLVKKWNSFEKRTTKHFSEKQKKLWQILIFLVRFALLAIPLHVLIWLNINALPLQEATAAAVGHVLSWLNVSFAREGIFLYVSTSTGLMQIEIIKDCLGWKSILALLGLIFAVRRITLKSRLIGLAIGVPIIIIGNIIRLATTFWLTAVKGVEFFEIVHSFLWQWGLIFLVLAVWIVWLSKLAKYIY